MAVMANTAVNKKYFYILAALLVILYLPALVDLVTDWYQDANYSHGFLVPLVSIYLIWRKRKDLSETEKSSHKFGLVLILFGMVLFILGNGASEYFTVRFSLVVTIFGIALYHFGSEIFRRTWFALFFLVFMIPIPYVIYFSATFPMQLFASKATTGLLNLIGMTIVRQGNIIYLPDHVLEVAEACSGMRSLVSLLALGAIYAYLTQRKLPAMIILILSTVPIAVIGNIFRVSLTAVIAYSSGADVMAEPIHSILGLSVFVAAFIMLFIFGAILRKIIR
jgi:exosortase